MLSREKDTNWTVEPGVGNRYSYEAAQLAVLMDLRDELKKLNALLHCTNFINIPGILRGIERNTKKRRKPRVVGKPKLRVVSR